MVAARGRSRCHARDDPAASLRWHEPETPMKTLFLVRHAKSGHDAGLKDRDRPLNERGLHDAPEMGERLAKRGVRPDRVLSSPAVRARTTAELLVKAFGIGSSEIAIDERLYAASPATLLAVIREQED